MSTYPPPYELSFGHEKCRCGSLPSFAIKNGWLLLQCKQKQNKCRDVVWSGKDEIYFSEFVCPNCNIPTSLRLSKTTKNPGKLFYSCSKCNYFRWWHRPLHRMSNEEDRVLNDGASSSASSSASASSSSTSSLALVGEVLCTVGEMMKRLGLEQN